jgi:hypothetical protein
MSLISKLARSTTKRGHVLEKDYFKFQQAMQAPLEMLNAPAIKQIEGFFADMVELGTCVKYLWQQQGYQLVFAFSPYNIAGHGHILTSVREDELIVSLPSGTVGTGEARYISPFYRLAYLSLLSSQLA